MGRTRPRRLLAFVAETPWAILPARLNTILEILEARAAGVAFTEAEMAARIGPRPAPRRTAGGPVAVLPLYGIIAPRVNMVTEISGGTSAEQFGHLYQAAIAEPEIAAVVLDVDSPGGSVLGIEELAATLRGGRGRKPVVAVANGLMASAAYWLASQVDEVVASPSSQVGSIGVVGVHQDQSAAEAKAGVKTTLVTAGKFKGEGNEHEPLGDTGREALQRMVDGYYTAFVRDVARGRGVTEAAVRGGFGEGRILSAREAVAAGLVDGLATLDQAVTRLAEGKRVLPLRAAASVPTLGEYEMRLPRSPLDAQAPRQGDALAEFRRRLAEHT